MKINPQSDNGTSDNGLVINIKNKSINFVKSKLIKLGN